MRRWTLAFLLVICLPVAAETLAEIRTIAAEQRYAEALEQLDGYLKDNPDDVEARLFKGVILTRQGNVEGAIVVFDNLSKNHPQLPEPLNNLAVLYAAQGRYEDAREVLVRAIELQPRYDTAHENLGDVYAKLANIAYERAFSLDRDNRGAKDKADWMTRVLDTKVDAPGEVPLAKPPPGQSEEQPRTPVEPVVQSAEDECYAVNGIESQDVAQSVIAWFGENGILANERIGEEKKSVIYAVFVPPLKSRDAANEQIRRMRDDGFADIMRINSGRLKNGISLGAYRKLENAERRVAAMRDKGYEAEYRPHTKTRTVRSVQVSAKSNPDLTHQFTTVFPRYALSVSPCP